jgi:hypothetical protein
MLGEKKATEKLAKTDKYQLLEKNISEFRSFT